MTEIWPMKYKHRCWVVLPINFFNLFIFNWRIIALQCCVGFCHTASWSIHRYIYVPSLLNLPPTSLPISPHRLSQSRHLSSLGHTTNSHGLSILYMVVCMFQHYPLNLSYPLLSPLCPQASKSFTGTHMCSSLFLSSTLGLGTHMM